MMPSEYQFDAVPNVLRSQNAFSRISQDAKALAPVSHEDILQKCIDLLQFRLYLVTPI